MCTLNTFFDNTKEVDFASCKVCTLVAVNRAVNEPKQFISKTESNSLLVIYFRNTDLLEMVISVVKQDRMRPTTFRELVVHTHRQRDVSA